MTTLYLDIETTGDPFTGRLLLAGWALDDGEVTSVEDGGIGTQTLRDLLADPDIVKVSQSTYDPRWFAMSRVELAGPWHDTKVMAWVLNENTPLDIDWLAWRYAGVDMDKRLKRSGGRVYFRTDDGELLDLATYNDWSYEHRVQFRAYNIRDVEALRDLYKALREHLEESEWEKYWLTEEVPFTSVLVRMESAGLPIDLPAVRQFSYELEDRLTEDRAKLLAEGGLPDSFNLNSQPQMVAYLFSRQFRLQDRLSYDQWTMGALKSCEAGEHDECLFGADADPEHDSHAALHTLDLLPEGFVMEKLGRDYVMGYWSLKGRGLEATPPNVNKVTGEKSKLPSVSSPELLYMHASDPWVLSLCTGYRKVEKLLTTYLRRFPQQAIDGRLYGSFNQTGTVTGRLSSSSPNLQNQPARGELGRRTRGLFRGNFIIGDYDQLEMRLMAHFSQDAKLVDVFRKGLDPHLITAQAIFGASVDAHSDERGIGKTLNFAIGYGAGPKKVAQVLSLAGYPTTKEVATGYLAELTSFYKGFYRWKEHTMAMAKRKGNVRTIGGRRRRLRGAFKDTANWKAMAYGERQAVNAIIQGSAADILRRTMVRADAEFPELRMLAQVHDEVIWEYTTFLPPSDLSQLQELFEQGHGFDLRVPLVFEPKAVDNWAEKDGVDVDFDEEEEDE